jgi:sarcosine oxidase delta subunit
MFVPNLGKMTTTDCEPVGQVWLLWVDEFARKENIQIKFLDVVSEDHHTGMVSLWVFDNEKDAQLFDDWQLEAAKRYNQQNIYDRVYPWHPITHWKTLHELGYAGCVHAIETPVRLFEDGHMDEMTYRHWLWMRTNVKGRVWHTDGEFWFEDARDATTYKMFLGGTNE